MRNLDPATSDALALNNVGYGVMAMFTFKTATEYLWSGPHDLTMTVGGAAQVFKGVGTLGSIGTIDEGSDGKAEGTTASLSGIDPVFLASALTDVRLGAPAKIWLVLLSAQMQVIGQPYLWFAGVVDKPPISVGGEDISIMLQLESQLANHERPNALKYTQADQRLLFPDDIGFNWTEQLNDIALRIDS